MRAGRLRDKARIVTLDHNLSQVCCGAIWCGITASESALAPMPAGLRAGVKVVVRARFNQKLQQGVYLMTKDRILHVTSVRDATGKRAELTASCDEFIGQAAIYTPVTGQQKPCRVHMAYDAPYLDELGQVTGYRIRAQVLLLEIGRPQVNDRITIDGQAFVVTQYAADTDDGVVRSLWLEKME